MTVPSALRFIAVLREDATLRARVTDSSRSISIDRLVEEAARHGFHFTAPELRTAFRHDWTMRWVVIGSGEPARDSARI